MHTLIWAVVVLFAAACTTTTTPEATPDARESGAQPAAAVHTLTIDEFAGILANEADRYIVVNVHIPYAGEVDGTDLKIAFNDIAALTAALPDKDAPIILYCRSGNMSAQATQALVERGYSQVYDVPGGMVDWQASGRAIVDR